MSKRRNRGEANNALDNLPFGNDESESGLDSFADLIPATPEKSSLSDIANDGYGSQVDVVADTFSSVGREKIRRIDITQIQPDPMQPRRAIPSSVRQYFSGTDHAAMMRLFENWLTEISLERGGRKLDVDAYLRSEVTDRAPLIVSDDDDTSPRQPGALETALLKIIDLATSIRRDGLTNPITIAREDSDYRLETGERRWLAYHLLNWRLGQLPGETDYAKIPARVMDSVNIWRQASENNTRDDLNAISRARQFALLLMDLHGTTNFTPATNFQTEQDFYAQVADSDNYRIPRGRGEDMLNAMGLKNTGQLRRIRQLLRLPEIVWTLADDLDWSEGFLRRNLLKRSNSEEDLIRLTLIEARKNGYSVPRGTVYAHLLEDSSVPQKKKDSPWQAFNSKQMPALEKSLRKLKGKQRQQAITQLRDLLDALEND